MRFQTGTREVHVDLPPIILVTMMEAWALYYYFSTVRIPGGGAASVLFIKPLVLGLSVCLPFVILSAIKVLPRQQPSLKALKRPAAADRGFLDHRRLFFTGALIAYAAGLAFWGYIIPSALFLFSVSYYLGSRSLWVLIILPLALSLSLSFFFRDVLMVPIPMWPSSPG
jgi:hypothetical protein